MTVHEAQPAAGRAGQAAGSAATPLAQLPGWVTLVRAPNPGPMTLDGTNTWAVAAACVAGAALVGTIGAFLPAWRMGRRDIHDLLWKEG